MQEGVAQSHVARLNVRPMPDNKEWIAEMSKCKITSRAAEIVPTIVRYKRSEGGVLPPFFLSMGGEADHV